MRGRAQQLSWWAAVANKVVWWGAVRWKRKQKAFRRVALADVSSEQRIIYRRGTRQAKQIMFIFYNAVIRHLFVPPNRRKANHVLFSIPPTRYEWITKASSLRQVFRRKVIFFPAGSSRFPCLSLYLEAAFFWLQQPNWLIAEPLLFQLLLIDFQVCVSHSVQPTSQEQICSSWKWKLLPQPVSMGLGASFLNGRLLLASRKNSQDSGQSLAIMATALAL